MVTMPVNNDKDRITVVLMEKIANKAPTRMKDIDDQVHALQSEIGNLRKGSDLDAEIAAAVSAVHGKIEN
jgi:hypothetical protein